MDGINHFAVFMRCGPSWIDAQFYENSCFLYIAPDTTIVSSKFHLQGSGKSIFVGRDCLFSWGIDIRTSDGHALIDLDSHSVLNPADSVTILSHVWIGFGVSIRKGVTVGPGSIIGSKSIVPKNIPRLVAAAGMPAKIIRENCTWTRDANPNSQAISQIALSSKDWN